MSMSNLRRPEPRIDCLIRANGDAELYLHADPSRRFMVHPDDGTDETGITPAIRAFRKDIELAGTTPPPT